MRHPQFHFNLNQNKYLNLLNLTVCNLTIDKKYKKIFIVIYHESGPSFCGAFGVVPLAFVFVLVEVGFVGSV